MKRIYLSIFTIIIFSFAIRAKDVMYFQEGTKWIVEIYPDEPYKPYMTETLTLKSIPGAEPNILALYTDLPNEYYYDAHCLNIKVEGEKVYFRLVDDTCVVPSAEQEGWYLMYDFGIEVGETCEVYNANAMRFHNDPAKCKATLKYVEFAQFEEIGSFLYMIMEELPYNERGIWLKGVGANAGVLYNCHFGYDGRGSKLVGLIYDGKEIFYNPSTAVKNVTDSSDFQVIVNGLTLIISASELCQPCYVYALDGKLLSVIDLSVSNTFTAPAPGCYIIKIGDLTKKILLD